MPSKSPEGRKAWSTDYSLVLRNNFFCGSFEEEVNVDTSTSSDVAQSTFTTILILEDRRLSICISKINSKIFSSVF
jgi:hypothetical protein